MELSTVIVYLTNAEDKLLLVCFYGSFLFGIFAAFLFAAASGRRLG